MRVAWVAVVCVACLARADSLSLSVASGTRCVTEASLRQQLTRAGLVVAAAGELDVDVSSGPDGAVRLRARRTQDARLLVRTLPVRSTCDGLELALVTLIREWATASALGLNPPRSPPGLAGADARLTRSDAGVTRSEPAMTRSEPAMTRSGPAMTRSGPAMTRSEPAMTRSDAGVTRSQVDLTRADSAGPRSAAGATGGEAAQTSQASTAPGDTATTRGGVDAKGSTVSAAPSDTATTSGGTVATGGDAPSALSDTATTRGGVVAKRGESSSVTSDTPTTRDGVENRGSSVSAAPSDSATTSGGSVATGDDAPSMPGDSATTRGGVVAKRGESSAEGSDTATTRGGVVPKRGESSAVTSDAATTRGDSSAAPSGAMTSATSKEPDSLPWDVRFAFAGGVTALIDAPVSPSGSALLDVGPGALGGSLEGAFDANVTLAGEGGTLTFNSQSLTLSARWRFTWERLSVDLGLGARGLRISATPAGFTTNTPATLFSVGPAVSATVWVRLAGPLQLVVRGVGAVRYPADQLNIVNGPTFRLGPWQVGAVAGLALAWP